jgi:hypothetical protein
MMINRTTTPRDQTPSQAIRTLWLSSRNGAAAQRGVDGGFYRMARIDGNYVLREPINGRLRVSDLPRPLNELRSVMIKARLHQLQGRMQVFA